MKKTMIWGLSILLLAGTVLAGCSTNNAGSNNNAGSTNNPSASANANKSPVALKAFMIGDPELDMNTNKFTQEMNEKLNVKLNIQINSNETAKEKRQLALTSGDYPDIFLLNWSDVITPSELMKLGSQGVLLPLNELIDKYGPNIKKRMEEIPNYKSITAPDGNIYGLPAINECYHCSFGSKMWVNTEWLKKVGMEMPKTTEDFKKMLVAFKETDLNGNGKKDEIPLSGAVGNPVASVLMNAFINDDSGTHCNNAPCYFISKDGKAEFTANKPEFKAGLEYIASLYAEGLIDPGAFSQNGPAYKQVVNRDGIATTGVAIGLHPYVFFDPNNPIHLQYEAIPPLKGPSGVQTTGYGGGKNLGGANFAISNKANKEQQIAAIKLADYLVTDEGTIRATHGEKGVNWTEGTASDLDLNGKPAKYKPIVLPLGETRKHNNAWSEVGPFVKTKDFRASWAADQDIKAKAGYELRLFKATQLYDGFQPKESFPGNMFIDPAAVEEYTMLLTNINKYVDENKVKFITGNKKFASDWDAYIEGFNKLKLDRYLEITQKAMDSTKKK
ncbi:extracellular solute-binding protein [Paenibacillus sp. V4I7]|uniref:extracellular solute-binding protein n=1 Tax=Paenibacillus sp. V4I7 TaxID=3042307 RepID=UPI002783C408|nr:extracellular solute-binding protein [Paenibacillus sp. V4I7]MDQ0900992.1 putative aldouronate transport system substrate-binding protein [Paenibacillus sp. V4I7]